jgi:hypothetical protein
MTPKRTDLLDVNSLCNSLTAGFKRKALSTVAALFIFSYSASQSTLHGRLIDSLSRQPVAFANLTLEDGRSGTTTEIEGNYSLSIPQGYHGLVYISHVSYQKRVVTVPFLQDNAVVFLQPGSTQLREVEVVASALENPAFAIVRQAIAHKRDNDPRYLKSYQFISYNKFMITMSEPSVKGDSLVQRLRAKADTAKLKKGQKEIIRLDSLAKTTHFFLSESVTDKQVINPDKDKEKLLALQVSGFKSAVFTNLATDFQPFSFYRDNISLLEKDFINPISKGTFSRYDFFLTDTTYFNQDTVYIIQFQPRKGKLFNGLTGVISICTNGYAIKNVIAASADPQMITRIRIQQNYDKIDGHWFPVQLNTDLDFLNLSFGGRHFIAQQRSFFKEVKINPTLNPYSFGDIKTDLSLPRPQENKMILDRYRNQELNKKELRTYTLLDSAMRKFKWIDRVIEATVVQTLPLGPLELDLTKVANINNYESFRLGGGLYTSNRFSRWLRLGGYAGYGFRDEQWKYGGEMRFNFNLDKDFYLRLSGAKDIRETGSPVNGNEYFRSWVSSQYDRIESYTMELGYRIFPDVHTSVFISRSDLTPTYNYQLLFNNELINHFAIAETGFSMRYVKRESYLGLQGKKIFLSSRFPVVTFSVAQAIQAFQSQNFNYIAFDFTTRELVKHRHGGKTYFYLASGWINGLAPYGKLYNGRGSSTSSLYVDDFFQTMGLYEFTASKYVSLFTNHNFGNILINKKYSKPELVLYHNMGIGQLENKAAHIGFLLQSFDKGFVESGLGLNNILRFKYANVAYYGLGGAVFYRYGPYQLPNSTDNLFWKMTLGLGF